MNYITKKAYVRGLAARGILRAMIMQKKAETSTSTVPEDDPFLLPENANLLPGNNTAEKHTSDATSSSAKPSSVNTNDIQHDTVDNTINKSTTSTSNNNDLDKKPLKFHGGRFDPNPSLFKSLRNYYVSSPFWRSDGGYLRSGLVGAGITGIIGALIQAARGKNLLSGALVGAGIGAGLGAGGKYISDKYIYPKALEGLRKDELADASLLMTDPRAQQAVLTGLVRPYGERGAFDSPQGQQYIQSLLNTLKQQSGMSMPQLPFSIPTTVE